MARTTNENYYYKFTDGYFMWSAGKLKGSERKYEERQHGKIVEEKRC